MLRSLLVHLRTPGEKHTIGQLAEGWGGPPPYAGRKGGPHPAEFTTYRSTPVRRGKGERLSSGRPSTPVHPRTPGEKNYVVETWGTYCGPPPYAGGKSRDPACPLGLRRSTPARRGKTAPGSVAPMQIAVHPRTPGKTTPTLPNSRTSAVHPRMPGENVDRDPGHQLCLGPPPHAGGKLRCSCSH